MYVRLSKLTLVWAIAFYISIVVINNLTDYYSNYQFVQHVLAMDTTFPDNRLMWRTIDVPALHHAAYILIIAVEAATALLCWWGGWRLWCTRGEAARFRAAKSVAVVGLTLGMLLWFTGFMTIGGEWYLMWQSEVWNGQQAAFRLVTILGITLIYLTQADEDPAAV